MAQITDQASLISEVATRISRVDFDATAAALPIQMAILQITRDATNRGAFIGKETTVTGTLTTNVETLALPAGLQSIRVIELLAPYATKLRVEPVDTFIEYFSDIIQGVPERYAVFGSNIIFNPTPISNFAYRMRYIATPDVAYLTANHPDLIFYATLLQATDNVRDSEAVQKYAAAYQTALEAAMLNENRKRTGHMPPQLPTNNYRRFNILAGR